MTQHLDPGLAEGIGRRPADAALEAVGEQGQPAGRVGFPDEFRPGMRHFLEQLLGTRGIARHLPCPAREEADGEKTGETADGDGHEQRNEEGSRLPHAVAAGPAGDEAGPEAGADETAAHHAERQPCHSLGPGLSRQRGWCAQGTLHATGAEFPGA